MAAKKKSSPPGDAYYEAMTATKVAAGLSLADAQEVTARQRAEDEANGLEIGSDDEPETETKTPEK
jgi:hypothetical protein